MQGVPSSNGTLGTAATLGPGAASDANKLFVGGLSQSATPEALHSYFVQFGVVTEVDVKCEPQTGRSRGFGFVTFAEPSSVERTLSLSAPHQIDGNWIEVKRFQRPSPGLGAVGKGMDAQEANSTRMCRHFFTGRCAFGEQCRFSHDMAAAGGAAAAAASAASGGICHQFAAAGGAAAAGAANSGICHQFVQGHCIFGATCRFKHVLDGQVVPGDADAAAGAAAVRPAQAAAPPVDALGAVLGALLGGSAAPTDGLKALSALATMASSPGPNLAPADPASAGSADPTPKPAPPLPASSTSGSSSSSSSINPCRHFLQGRCRYGDACRFPHVGGPEGTVQGHPKANTVFLGGLPWTVTEATLLAHFSSFGTVRSLEIKRDAAGVSRGFGFADFIEDGAADAALAVPDAHVIDGRPIEVRRHYGSLALPSGAPVWPVRGSAATRPPSTMAATATAAASAASAAPLGDTAALARALSALLGGNAALGSLAAAAGPQGNVAEMAQQLTSALSQQAPPQPQGFSAAVQGLLAGVRAAPY